MIQLQRFITPEQASWLSDNYMIGIGVITGVISLVYILISILIILKAKKCQVGMACLGMIPFVRIIGYFVKIHSYKKQQKLEKFRESIDMDGELEL